MALKPKEGSLLFSGNISSPFDNISSTPVIIPPHTSIQEPVQSLQPHLKVLEQDKLPTKWEEITSLTQSTDNQTQPTQLVPTLPPPKDLTPSRIISGGPFLRRPTNKYVVPIEINASTPVTQITHLYPPLLPSLSSSTVLPSTTNLLSEDVCYQPPYINSSISSIPTTTIQPVNKFVSISNHMPSVTSTIIPTSFDVMASNPPQQSEMYHPVMHHWFYSEGPSESWKPFSFTDSLNLEDVFRSECNESVATDGGRYDVDVLARKRMPVYWDGEAGPVMRCSWFRRTYSGTNPIPFSEEIAEKLEAEYKDAVNSSIWHRQVEVSSSERVMINSPISMHYYQLPDITDIQTVPSISESQAPLAVRRGADDFVIKEGASEQVDHLLFLIHGIGSACDLSFRSVEECVDDFRSMGEDLLATHFKEAIDCGKVGRVEILPISWHKALHGDATGLDAKLKHITLRSIPKFREFTNDTLLDVLFYTSPVYCQHIMDTVASEMDRLLSLFRMRNPNYNGSVSVGGHSLGSVILFDLLMHQNILPEINPTKIDEDSLVSSISETCEVVDEDRQNSLTSTSQIDFQVGVAGTGQPVIVYPQLSFKPQAFFLMGSPVGMFITVRGIDKLGPLFKLPTCDRVFNIFHPFDPVAYRVETLIDTTFEELRPVLVPHHKGRKRMHLELKDTIERVGADIKSKIVDSIQSTWNKFYQIYSGNTEGVVREEVDQALEEHMERMRSDSDVISNPQMNTKIGELNRGERIDYVLQEKPYESFTEYIFALQAHVSYWKSEDTLLMILKELYKIQNISSDSSMQQLEHTTQSSPKDYFPPVNYVSSNSQQFGLDSLQTTSPSDIDLLPPPPPTIPLLTTNDIATSVNLLPTLQGQSLSSPLPPSSLPSLPLSTSVIPVNPSSKPKTLRGRPVFDSFNAPISNIGMDPTVSPTSGSSAALPPPPILPSMCFTKKHASKNK